MRLATVTPPHGQTTAAAIVRDGAVDVLPFNDVTELLAERDWREAAAMRTVARIPLDSPGLTWAPPVRPTKMICVGLNYKSHILETGRQTPSWPTLFAKFPDTLAGPYDPIAMPDVSDQVDWEVELGVVIGKTVKHADQRTAQAAIAGYTVINDVSMRDWQGRTAQWLQGKNFERTTPFGPAVVTADEIDPTCPLAIRCWVDDELVQESVTSDLLFGPVELVEYISRFTTLRPGDVIATGTPGGVGASRVPQRFLTPGETLTSRVEGIGTLVNRFTTS